MTHTERVERLKAEKAALVDTMMLEVAAGLMMSHTEEVLSIDQRLAKLDPWGRFSEENGLGQ